MNKQRKVVITITYNELGIIIDTKTEEVQLATDTISRQAAIDAIADYERDSTAPIDYRAIIESLPSAHPEPQIIRCKDCKWLDRFDDNEIWCGVWCNRTEDNAYCSYAERRQNG